MTRKPEGWPCSVVMCLTTSEYTVTGSGPPEQAAPASRASARVVARITGEESSRGTGPGDDILGRCPGGGRRPHRLEAQDTALSRRRHGFESRWGHATE